MSRPTDIIRSQVVDVTRTAPTLGWNLLKLTGISLLKTADAGHDLYTSAQNSRIMDRVVDGVSSLLRHDLGGPRTFDITSQEIMINDTIMNVPDSRIDDN